MEFLHETSRMGLSKWDNVSWTRKTTLVVLVELSALAKNPFPGHNFWTVQNFFMQLHRWVYLNETMYHKQGRQLSLFCFLNYLPLLKIRVQAITPESYGISSWNFTDEFILARRCVTNIEDNSHCFAFWIICPCWKSGNKWNFFKKLFKLKTMIPVAGSGFSLFLFYVSLLNYTLKFDTFKIILEYYLAL